MNYRGATLPRLLTERAIQASVMRSCASDEAAAYEHARRVVREVDLEIEYRAQMNRDAFNAGKPQPFPLNQESQ